MIFAHDTEIGLVSAAALVNTIDGDIELLPDLAALDDFIRFWRWSGRRDHTPEELAQVRALRPRLRAFWQVDEAGAVERVNQLLRDAHAVPQLVKHDGLDYHIHAVPMDAPLATRMVIEAAMAMVDVIRTKEMSRLRICEYPSCNFVVVDLSKNRSKRFCDAGCGNRAAVAAYRARKAGQAARLDETRELPWEPDASASPEPRDKPQAHSAPASPPRPAKRSAAPGSRRDRG
jgi:predicted RNA-binding Zn ribbon-like protein